MNDATGYCSECGTADPAEQARRRFRASLVSEERLAWIERWATGWRENLSRRPAERYYADLPLEVAADLIIELLAEARRAYQSKEEPCATADTARTALPSAADAKVRESA